MKVTELAKAVAWQGVQEGSSELLASIAYLCPDKEERDDFVQRIRTNKSRYSDIVEAPHNKEPESNTNPNGTGKKNPMDCVVRLIGLAYEADAGLAREMAEVFTAYVDFRDGKQGTQIGGIQELLAKNVKEHSDVVIELVQSKEPNWERVLTESKQSEAAMNQLQAYASAQLRKDAIG